MIKTENGNIQIRGSQYILWADLVVIMRHLRKCGALTEKELRESVDKSLLSDEELDKCTSDAVECIIDMLKEILEN